MFVEWSCEQLESLACRVLIAFVTDWPEKEISTLRGLSKCSLCSYEACSNEYLKWNKQFKQMYRETKCYYKACSYKYLESNKQFECHGAGFFLWRERTVRWRWLYNSCARVFFHFYVFRGRVSLGERPPASPWAPPLVASSTAFRQSHYTVYSYQIDVMHNVGGIPSSCLRSDWILSSKYLE